MHLKLCHWPEKGESILKYGLANMTFAPLTRPSGQFQDFLSSESLGRHAGYLTFVLRAGIGKTNPTNSSATFSFSKRSIVVVETGIRGKDKKTSG